MEPKITKISDEELEITIERKIVVTKTKLLEQKARIEAKLAEFDQ